MLPFNISPKFENLYPYCYEWDFYCCYNFGTNGVFFLLILRITQVSISSVIADVLECAISTPTLVRWTPCVVRVSLPWPRHSPSPILRGVVIYLCELALWARPAGFEPATYCMSVNASFVLYLRVSVAGFEPAFSAPLRLTA